MRALFSPPYRVNRLVSEIENRSVNITVSLFQLLNRQFCSLRVVFRASCTVKARGVDSDDTVSRGRSVTVRLGSTYQIATLSLSNALHKILLRLSADPHDNERRLKKLTRLCS
jgi:hypothetical protein